MITGKKGGRWLTLDMNRALSVVQKAGIVVEIISGVMLMAVGIAILVATMNGQLLLIG